MVNLLFISNSPKSESIVSALQPKLKVRIDVVTDFDLGLKDVFEKRPATVLIQDQIAGVTGESVARHIQMLLGSGAPSFVMIHDGGGLIKPIKGLVEHLVDLTQPNIKIVADILGILKSIFGSEWDKIIIAPQLAPAEIASPAAPEDRRQGAESLIRNVVTDPGQVIEEDLSQQVLETESPTDELARLLVESARKDKQPKAPALAVQPDQGDLSRIPAVPSKPSLSHTQTASPVVSPLDNTPEPLPSSDVAAFPKTPAPAPEMAARPKKTIESSRPVPTSADFSIAAPANERRDEIPDDLLLQFEKNFHAQARKRRLYIVVMVLVVVLAVAAWLLRQSRGNGSSAGSLGVRKPIAATVIPAGDVSVPKAPAMVQTKPTSAQKADPAPAAQRPAFIDGATRDDSFGVGKPGWERYVGKTAEYRLFRLEGQIKAVQVLAKPGQAISHASLRNILTDVAGKSVYKIRSTEQKDGYLVQRAVVPDNNADLLLYLKKHSGKIRAFVISVN